MTPFSTFKKIAFCLIIPAVLFFHSASGQNDSLSAIVNKATSDTAKFRICNQISVKLSTSDNASAIYYAKMADDIAVKRKDLHEEGEALGNLAFALYNSGEIDTAMALYSKSIRVSRLVGDSDQVVFAINRLAAMYREKRDNATAIKYYNQALLSNKGEKNIAEAAYSYLNLGVVCQDQKNMKDALRYEEKGLELYLLTKDDGRIANCYARLGNIYLTEKDSVKAFDYYQKSLTLFEKANHKRGIAICMNNMAMILDGWNQDEKALDYYFKAMAIRESIGDKNGVAILCNNIAANYQMNKQNEKAIQYFNRSLAISRELGLKDLMQDNYLGLSVVYENMGDVKHAYENYKLFHIMYDSLFNERNSKQINELNAQFDTERKQQEIEMLSKDAKLNAIEREKNAAELEKKNTQTWLLIAGLIAAAILSFVILTSAIRSRRANVILEKQKNEIATQKKIVEEQHHDIIDSINYAQRIQHAVLPSEKEMQLLFPKSFAYFQPRDIVSGDFWWMGQNGKIKIIAVADCTGHGVPGAFMSLIGNTALNEIIKEKHISDPGEILTHLSLGIVAALKQDNIEDGKANKQLLLNGVKDGMDIAICCIDEENKTIKYAGANNPIYYIQGATLCEIKADRQPVGIFEGELKPFTVHTLDLKTISAFYLFSDGYADQFGGPNGKKFKYSRLKELLFSIHTQSPSDQEKSLDAQFKSWKGTLDQVDDVCVVGIVI